MAYKRLQNEIHKIRDNVSPIAFEAFPFEGDQYHWKGHFTGPVNSLYEGGTFHLDIQFPKQYPFAAPIITFTTAIYHLNISKEGRICLDELNHSWSPVITIKKISELLHSILEQPLGVENAL